MAKLTYRNIEPDDFAALHAIALQWDVVRQLGSWPWPAQESFTRSRAKLYVGDGFVWAICLDGDLIGSIASTAGSIGYKLDPQYQRQGIMTKAVTHVINHTFTTTNRDTLNASTWHDNAGSNHILTNAGFIHWQSRYEYSVARGAPTLCRHYRLHRTTWDRLRSRTV